MVFTVKNINRKVSDSGGSLKDITWVDMETKGVQTFTPTACNVRSLYMLKVRNRITCSVVEKQTVCKSARLGQMRPHT